MCPLSEHALFTCSSQTLLSLMVLTGIKVLTLFLFSSSCLVCSSPDLCMLNVSNICFTCLFDCVDLHLHLPFCSKGSLMSLWSIKASSCSAQFCNFDSGLCIRAQQNHPVHDPPHGQGVQFGYSSVVSWRWLCDLLWMLPAISEGEHQCWSSKELSIVAANPVLSCFLKH